MLGYFVQTPISEVLPFRQVLKMLPEDTLAFAAHPFDIAQPPPPGTWIVEDLDDLRLTGYEFWNTRSRRSAGVTYNPLTWAAWQDPKKLFEQASWKSSKKLAEQDEKRIADLRDMVKEKWEPALERGVNEWSALDNLPKRRPVFIAGTDAHGSFNYTVGLFASNYQKIQAVNDNALGRVRTAVYLPDHNKNTVPEIADILVALKKGSCVVTDGPVIEFSVGYNGNVAHMGEVLTVTKDDDLGMEIVAHTTSEFGQVEQVEVVAYFKDRKRPRFTEKVEAGENIKLEGLQGQGYCRVQARTFGQNGEHFCCFTNPIWVRITDGKKKDMQVRFAFS